MADTSWRRSPRTASRGAGLADLDGDAAAAGGRPHPLDGLGHDEVRRAPVVARARPRRPRSGSARGGRRWCGRPGRPRADIRSARRGTPPGRPRRARVSASSPSAPTGVLSSWLMLATKSRRTASRRRRSDTSSITTRAPMRRCSSSLAVAGRSARGSAEAGPNRSTVRAAGRPRPRRRRLTSRGSWPLRRARRWPASTSASPWRAGEVAGGHLVAVARSCRPRRRRRPPVGSRQRPGEAALGPHRVAAPPGRCARPRARAPRSAAASPAAPATAGALRIESAHSPRSRAARRRCCASNAPTRWPARGRRSRPRPRRAVTGRPRPGGGRRRRGGPRRGRRRCARAASR